MAHQTVSRWVSLWLMAKNLIFINLSCQVIPRKKIFLTPCFRSQKWAQRGPIGQLVAGTTGSIVTTSGGSLSANKGKHSLSNQFTFPNLNFTKWPQLYYQFKISVQPSIVTGVIEQETTPKNNLIVKSEKTDLYEFGFIHMATQDVFYKMYVLDMK